MIDFLVYPAKMLAIDITVTLPIFHELVKPFCTFQEFIVIEGKLNLSCHIKQ